MAFDAARVCNNILSRAFEENVSVTPMKLQKILYFVASEYAKDTGNPLLLDQFQPWQYGPVVASVYSEFKPYGARAIRSYAKDSEGKAYIVAEDSNPALKAALNRVWPAVRRRSAVDLSRITHAEGSAWRAAWERGRNTIRHDDIQTDRTYRSPLQLR